MQQDPQQLEEELVVAHLQADPDFFARHPELLAQLRLPAQHQGVVSLAEKQTQVLRDKVVSLQEEITDLMVVARQNEKIYQIFVDLYIQLLGCKTLQQTQNCIADIFAEQLQMSAVSLKLFDEGIAETAHQLPKLGQKALQENRFDKDDYYLGRLNHAEQQWLFSDDTQVASVALILLGEGAEKRGILAIASGKEEHFQPQMDTLFIAQLQKLLSRFLTTHFEC